MKMLVPSNTSSMSFKTFDSFFESRPASFSLSVLRLTRTYRIATFKAKSPHFKFLSSYITLRRDRNALLSVCSNILHGKVSAMLC